MVDKSNDNGDVSPSRVSSFRVDWLLSLAKDLYEELTVPSRLIAFVAGAALIVIVGPFGTFDMPFGRRAGFWVSWFSTVWLACTVLFAALQSFVTRAYVKRWHLSLAAFLMTVPIAAFLGVSIALQFFPKLVMSWQNLYLEAKFLSPIVGCIIIILHMSMARSQESAQQTLETAANVGGDQFFARLPKNIGRTLVCISVSDHYLKVETKMGEALILGSLTEAVSQLDGYAGCQVHRSHWVALDAVKDREWVGQKMQLNLANGSSVPVSRSFRRQTLEMLDAAAV